MKDSLRLNDPQTFQRLDSVACLLKWSATLSEPDRQRLIAAIFESGDRVQQIVTPLLPVVKNPNATNTDREQALREIEKVLFVESEQPGTQQESFAERLKQLMAAKQVSQQELAERVGCSQPAISQMLNRMCRPQKRTILKLAEALTVHPHELWPDMDVADMLDAVASFQQDDYTMTAEEAKALSGTAQKNRPKIRAKSLPSRE